MEIRVEPIERLCRWLAKNLSKKVVNFVTPNMITFLRVPLGLTIFYLVFSNNPNRNLSIIVLLALAGLTDLFDGPWARATSRISEEGKKLDAVVDKFLIFPCIFLLLDIGKQIFVLILGLKITTCIIALFWSFLGKKVEVTPAGKISMWIMPFGFILILLGVSGSWIKIYFYSLVAPVEFLNIILLARQKK